MSRFGWPLGAVVNNKVAGCGNYNWDSTDGVVYLGVSPTTDMAPEALESKSFRPICAAIRAPSALPLRYSLGCDLGLALALDPRCAPPTFRSAGN